MVYLVETYRSRAASRERHSIRRLQADVAACAVHLVGRLVVPADETEFWLFEAGSMAEVANTLAVVGIDGGRISQVEELTLLGPSDRDPARQEPIVGFGWSA